MAPSARPRTASGTARWKIVVRDDLEDEAAGRRDREGDERDREGLGQAEDRQPGRGHEPPGHEDGAEARAQHKGARDDRAEDPADCRSPHSGRRCPPRRCRRRCGEDDSQHGDAAEREARDDVDGREAQDDASRERAVLPDAAPRRPGSRQPPERRLRQRRRRGQPGQHDCDDGERRRVEDEREREPADAIRIPAIAGPRANARLSSVAHAEFAGPSWRSSATRVGRYAPIVGPKNVEKHVARIASATTASTGPSVATSQASTTMIAPRAMSVAMQDPPPVEPVRHDPGRNREQDIRQDARRADDAQQDRVLGPCVHDDQQRDQVEPVPDRADELADQQADERAVCEELAVCAEPAQEMVTQATARSGPARART